MAARTAGTVENFAQGYQDYLQAPLQVSATHFSATSMYADIERYCQPLMDNLQSMTYNTFEQDPVKYRNYEEVCWVDLLTSIQPQLIFPVGHLPCYHGMAEVREAVSDI